MQLNKRLKVKKYSHTLEKYRKKIVYYIIIALLILGFIYQHISIYTNASHLGRVGQIIEVDNVNMHLYQEGSGDFPIVFAANIGVSSPYTAMYRLHSILKSSHPVYVYDKPGYGWSDLTSSVRNIDQITTEIHDLLHAGLEDDDEFVPFIYVAYSMGSLEALRYAQLYPEDIAGIVLIDGAAPSFCEDYNNIMILESFFTNMLRNTGLLRLGQKTHYVSSSLCMDKDLPKNIRSLSIGLGLEKAWNRNVLSEKLKVSDNAKTILDGPDLGDIPLRIITSENNPYGSWSRSQKSLLKLSTDAAQSYIKGSVDYIEKNDVPNILNVIEELTSHITELQENY